MCRAQCRLRRHYSPLFHHCNPATTDLVARSIGEASDIKIGESGREMQAGERLRRRLDRAARVIAPRPLDAQSMVTQRARMIATKRFPTNQGGGAGFIGPASVVTAARGGCANCASPVQAIVSVPCSCPPYPLESSLLPQAARVGSVNTCCPTISGGPPVLAPSKDERCCT